MLQFHSTLVPQTERTLAVKSALDGPWKVQFEYSSFSPKLLHNTNHIIVDRNASEMFQKHTSDPNTKSPTAATLSFSSLEKLYFQLHSALMTLKYLLRMFINHMPNIQKN